MADAKVCVAAIAGSFGVRGDVRLKSFCAIPEDVETYGSLTTEDGSQSYDVRLAQSVKNGFVARLTGITSKEQADALKGVRLYVDRDKLPDLPDDEYYHADLIGLEVRDTGGALLGTVRAVHDHGAGDLLEIHATGLSSTILMPFTLAIVPTVDLRGGRIVADPPEGLFPDGNDAPE
jgi:16S rRNA processing protein RimM